MIADFLLPGFDLFGLFCGTGLGGSLAINCVLSWPGISIGKEIEDLRIGLVLRLPRHLILDLDPIELERPNVDLDLKDCGDADLSEPIDATPSPDAGLKSSLLRSTSGIPRLGRLAKF
jgi:hypothetical protein